MERHLRERCGITSAQAKNVMVAGQPAAERLLEQIVREPRVGTPLPTKRQVAMVLHALADHTAIMTALKHGPDPGSPWPEATSSGRWLHDVGNDLESTGA